MRLSCQFPRDLFVEDFLDGDGDDGLVLGREETPDLGERVGRVVEGDEEDPFGLTTRGDYDMQRGDGGFPSGEHKPASDRTFGVLPCAFLLGSRQGEFL